MATLSTDPNPVPSTDSLSPGQTLRQRLASHAAERGPSIEGGPIRVAYVTSLREIESEGVGGLLATSRDALYHLQSYRLNGHIPSADAPSSQHLFHAQGMTYEITVIIADDDFISPRMGQRLAATGLASYVEPSSSWRTIRQREYKAFAKAQYEWKAFQSKRLVHGFDIILSDSYRMLFDQAALSGRLFSSDIRADAAQSQAAFETALAGFNAGVSPKVDLELDPAVFSRLVSEPGSSVPCSGFTLRHEVDAHGNSLGRIALHTLPMEGLILNIHPAYTHDLPGYTPTSDALFRHALFRRVNSRENFITRNGVRHYRIPLHDAYLFSAQSPRDLLFELSERRITGLSALVRDHIEGISNASDLDGMRFHAIKEKTTRQYFLRVRGGRIDVLENEAARASALFGRFEGTSVEEGPDGRSYLILPVDGERGRFLSKTGATLHYVDSGIDTGATIRYSRSTPVRNSDSSFVAHPNGQPPRSSVDNGNANSYRDGEQRLRERNYDTKGNTLVRGLLGVLSRPDVLARIEANRAACREVLASNPSLARANHLMQKSAIHAPRLVPRS